MKAFTKKIASPRHDRWMDEQILILGTTAYTRRYLDQMGVGLHTIAAKRLANKVAEHQVGLAELFRMKLNGVLRLGGIGESSAIVISHILDDQDYDVFAWIGAKGRSYKGAMANAKAKSKKIPGRNSRRGKK